jgi:EAL domain-containing protein (putative c-di-GMP-specific phosphodiesterase class I)
MRILEELRTALGEQRLRVYAQPICDLETRAVERYELLVRMVTADGTIVPPCSFLPAAERHGLISEIDAWVLERGIEIVRRGTAVNINVSAASLARTDLLEPVRRAIDHGLDPANIAFEITETAMAADLDNAIAFAERAGGLGCRIVIDDFGVGFGSLTYVQRLSHVCCLKIDRTFVTHVVECSADQRIVSAVVRLAQSFEQNTVAEGIETEEALALVRSLGVRYGQGYLFGRPEPVKHLLAHAV